MLIWRRQAGQVRLAEPDRDFFVDEALANHRGALVDPVSMPAEALLFQMYTSGITGRPEGGHHGHLPTWIRE